MLGKTHKAFGATAIAITAIGYYHITGHHITQDLVFELNTTPTNETLLHIKPNSSEYVNWFHPLVQYIVLLLAGIIGASAPDIDQSIPGMKHRTWTHTLWAILIFSGLTYYLRYHYLSNELLIDMSLVIAMFGFTIGYASHLFGDAFSTSGIDWFYPLIGYKTYGSGASVVRGFRGPFIPIYSVGHGVIGAGFWSGVAFILSLYYILLL